MKNKIIRFNFRFKTSSYQELFFMPDKQYLLSILILLYSSMYNISSCQENIPIKASRLKIDQAKIKSLSISQPQIVWEKELATHAYSGSCLSNDAVIDNDGNSYITGNITGLGTDIDFLTIKIDSSGKVLWTSRHDGPLHWRDEATGITIDSIGNTYVSGLQNGLDNTLELITIKINTTGNEEWIKSNQYHGSFFYQTKITVDKNGNISSAVPDFSYTTGLFRLIVAQYSQSGAERWSRIIDSCAHLSKILPDNERNLYLISEYGYANCNSIIIKLDSTGKVLWKKPVQPMIYDAMIDNRGSLVVTGGSTRDFNSCFFIGKVDQKGNFAWQDQDTLFKATSGRAITENCHNEYCVSAIMVYGGSDIIIYQYDSIGHRNWSYTYNSASTDISTTTHISVSKNDDIFVGSVTWYNYLLIRLSEYGSFMGSTTTTGGTFLAGKFSNKDRYYAAGNYNNATSSNQSSGFSSSLFSPDGNIEWSKIYHDSTNSLDNAIDMIYDPSGYLYICGTSAITSTEKRLALWKMDKNGTIIWYTSVGDTSNAVYECRGMQRDPSGNIVLVSDYQTQQHTQTFFVTKIDTMGTVLWSKPFRSYTNEYKTMPSIFAIDSTENIYIVDYYYCLTKINPAGEIIWSRQCTKTNTDYDYPKCVRLGKDGGIYVAGSNLGDDGHLDFLLLRYDSSGTQTWNKRYIEMNNKEETMAAMIQDDSSNSYCIGSAEGGRGTWSYPQDFLITKNDLSGNMNWSSRIDTTFGDQLTNACFDNKGNFIAIGRTMTEGSPSDFAVLKYTPDGNLIWISAPLNFPSVYDDEATHVCCDKSNNIYVLGYSNATGCLEIVQYSPEGTIQWNAQYVGSYYGSDQPSAFTIDKDNNLFILETNLTPADLASDPSSTIQIIKINTGIVSSIKGYQHEIPSRLSLSCWPNPFNPTTNISYFLPEQTKVHITVYNLLGQEVVQLVNEYQQAGQHMIKWSTSGHYASGVYFCRIKTDRESKVEKMFLIK
ncbi:MAG TPA: T9SS type A sorting domain-containing protein [Bacteroidota bacterium]|nr:T9SS type A sorting domain-containing protein [Bacteroidota bacterium]